MKNYIDKIILCILVVGMASLIEYFLNINYNIFHDSFDMIAFVFKIIIYLISFVIVDLLINIIKKRFTPKK